MYSGATVTQIGPETSICESTTGCVLMLNGWAVAWKSKRQSLVAMSTAETEYIAVSLRLQELIYMRWLLDTLGFPQPSQSDVFEDYCTVITWSEGAVGGSNRAKHIDIRLFFLQEAVAEGGGVPEADRERGQPGGSAHQAPSARGRAPFSPLGAVLVDGFQPWGCWPVLGRGGVLYSIQPMPGCRPRIVGRVPPANTVVIGQMFD